MLTIIAYSFFSFLAGFFLCAVFTINKLNRLEDKRLILEVTEIKIKKVIRILKKYKRLNMDERKINFSLEILGRIKEDLENENSKSER